MIEFKNLRESKPRHIPPTSVSKPLAACAMLLVLIAGCVPSLHAIHTPEDVAFDEALLGSWSPEEQNETWVFTKLGESAYRLVQTDRESKIGVFEATLAEIDGTRFLDLTPMEEPPLSQNALWKWHLVPSHTFLLVESTSPTLRLRAMNPNWAKEYLHTHPDELEHVLQNDRVIITAETAAVQKFATRHVGTPDAYGDVYELTTNQ